MKEKIRIVGIGGSMESNSSSLLYLNYTLDVLKQLGSDVQLVDIKTIELPLYNYSKEVEAGGEDLKKLLDNIHKADGYIFASPEYHGTVSSSFKNIIDYFEFLSSYNPPYLSKKPVGCIALAGAENSGSATLSTMVNIVHSLRGIVAPSSLAIGSAYKQINEYGNVTNDSLKRKLNRLAEEVYSLSVKLK